VSEFWHIVDRSLLHFFMAAGVQLIGLHGFWYLERKKLIPPIKGWLNYIIPAVLSFAIISMREPFDVAEGQLLIKVVTDWISWLCGLAAAIYALYRIAPRLDSINNSL
jgi:hypothetical protein